MKIFTFLLFLSAIFLFSCSSGMNSIFGKKTPHERYEKRMDELDLDETPQGREWKAASFKALTHPVSLQAPFAIQGHFPAGRARALGIRFQAKRGEQLKFVLDRSSGQPFIVYADLYSEEGTETEHLYSAETDSAEFSIDIEETGSYILRLQPQLNHTGDYRISASSGPSLGFPVLDKKARVGSFWGDDRDGGKRRHEGIDIFAPKKSPVIASADGYVTSVDEGGLGGKTVWLRPTGKNYTLYYAHLDEQLVSPGQFVKKGETIGLVGNTGNAQHTPAHLHFGIYTYGGPVDPFPFVNKSIKSAPAIVSKDLALQLQLLKPQKTSEGNDIQANTLLTPLAVTGRTYIAELPDGNLIQVSQSLVKVAARKSPSLVNKAEPPSKKS